jgi:hypothetical protein
MGNFFPGYNLRDNNTYERKQTDVTLWQITDVSSGSFLHQLQERDHIKSKEMTAERKLNRRLFSLHNICQYARLILYTKQHY